MSLERGLIVPDSHAPHHDLRAWKLMLKIARAFKPQILIHQGDLADCFSLSFHSKDPARKSRWKEEREGARKCRADLDRLGAKRKIISLGNHEYRLLRYMWDRSPELEGCLDIDTELQLSENDWEIIQYKEHGRWGKLYISHEVGGGGKYPTARALEAFQHSNVTAHHHRMQFFVEGDATGKYRVAASFGWLGDRRSVDYMHKIKANRFWPHGFGVGYRDTDSNVVHLVPIPIVNYTAVLEGRIYRG